MVDVPLELFEQARGADAWCHCQYLRCHCRDADPMQEVTHDRRTVCIGSSMSGICQRYGDGATIAGDMEDTGGGGLRRDDNTSS